MYKVICNLTHAVIWTTDKFPEAKMIALKYQAAIYKRNRKIEDFSQEEKYVWILCIDDFLWRNSFDVLLRLLHSNFSF